MVKLVPRPKKILLVPVPVFTQHEEPEHKLLRDKLNQTTFKKSSFLHSVQLKSIYYFLLQQ